jgi:hypothetical protein
MRPSPGWLIHTVQPTMPVPTEVNGMLLPRGVGVDELLEAVQQGWRRGSR